MNRLITRGAMTAYAMLSILSCSDSTAPDGLSADDLSADANRIIGSIVVTITPSTINVGDTARAKAAVYDRRGQPLNRSITWSSSDVNVATVTDSGLVTGIAPGSAVITGSHNAHSGTATVNVTTVGGTGVAPVATVTVSLASSTLTVGQTTQATATTRDSAGNVLTGRTVKWGSSDSAIAIVSDSGRVTGLTAGSAQIIATSETKSGSAPLTVQSGPPPPPPPTGTIADPTQLPLASGQTPPAGSYGKLLSSGQTYNDPVSGLPVLKVTDASTPISNSRAHHDYSEGGPYISQPWQGTDGNTYYTLMVAAEPNRYLVDVRYDNMTMSNWRPIDLDGDVSFAFSLDPATPRIAFAELNSASGTVQRYNTATNRIENTGNFPWRPGVGSLNWLQTQLNDKWLVAMGNNVTVVAWHVSDAVQRSYAPSNLDEPHIDREQPFAYLAVGNQIYVCNLTTGAAPFLAPGDPAWSYHPNSLENSDHAAPLRGHLVGVANSANLKYYSYDVLANATTSYTGVENVAGFPGEEHRSGAWVFNNGNSSTSQWWTIDPSASDDSRAKIRSGMIGMSNIDGSASRIVAVHNATGGSNYAVQPHTTIAPDGHFVMWTSDNKGSRTDVYLVRLPTR